MIKWDWMRSTEFKCNQLRLRWNDCMIGWDKVRSTGSSEIKMNGDQMSLSNINWVQERPGKIEMEWDEARSRSSEIKLNQVKSTDFKWVQEQVKFRWSEIK